MHILILSNIPPWTVGGAEVQALALANQWVQAGHRVTIAGHDNVAGGEAPFAVRRIAVWRASRATRALSFLLSTIWLLWRTRNAVDLVYCRFLKEHAFAAALAKCMGVISHPVVACPALASKAGDVENIQKSRVRVLWVSVLGRGVSAINAMSGQIVREVLSLRLSATKLSTIPNGVAVSGEIIRSSCNGGVLRLLFVGRLVEQKGLDTLLAAARLLMASDVRFHLQIVGGGPLRGLLDDQIASFGLKSHVALAGALSREDVLDVFSNADLFVLPSRQEGMSGALLEAMAHGLPVIATRISGSEEVVDSSIGWLVPVDDERAIAAAVVQAIEVGQSGLLDMGRLARRKVLRDFDIKRVAARYLELFEGLVNESES